MDDDQRDTSVELDFPGKESSPIKVSKPLNISDQSSIPPGKKVPKHLLEKRRIGRIKAAEEFSKKLKQIGIGKQENLHINQFGLFKPLPLINQKNYSSDYLKKDDQIFAMRQRKNLRTGNNIMNTPDLDDEGNDDIEIGNSNTIVIHPGSRFLKIGRSTDVFPLTIPSCIAIPKTRVVGSCSQQKRFDTNQEFLELKKQIQSDFKERMRYYKRKILPNSNQQVEYFNDHSKPELIPEHNDLHRIEWISDTSRVYFGEDATKCLSEYFQLRYPFSSDSFNLNDKGYLSFYEILNDIVSILEYALDKLKVSKRQFSSYKVILIVPDLFKKNYVETMIRLLLIEMEFQSCALIQESLASSYGAGISNSTCVIDIGAQQTKISCVDEGQVIMNSVLTLPFGGDNLTKLFVELLLQSKFPYSEWNLNERNGWQLAEQLKKKCLTFQDADIAIQLYNFIRREPNEKVAQKFDFKLFDEVMLAPMSLFYPEILKIMESPIEKNSYLNAQFLASKDTYTNKPNDIISFTLSECNNDNKIWYTEMQRDLDILQKLLDLPAKMESFNEGADIIEERLNHPIRMPLEKAIIESITNASIFIDDHCSKISQFYSNLLIVGGSSKIPALDFILTDRINIWRPRLLSISTLSPFLKKLNEKVKNFNTENQLSKIEETTENSELLTTLKKKLIKLIKLELETYWDSVNLLNGNETVFPINVLPPPREMDPATLTWKGGCVFSRIKLCEELLITKNDWEILGSRILQYKCIFDY